MAWPKLTKNANFRPNLVVFGQKILIFTRKVKSFVTHIMGNPPRHLVRIVFLSGMARNGQKCHFWAKFGRFLAKIPNFNGRKQKFGTHIMYKPPRHLVCIVFWSGTSPKGSERPTFGPKWPKMHILGQICPFFGPKSYFFWQRSKKFGTQISEKS